MGAKKGTRPPAAGRGRLAVKDGGSPNKITKQIKDMVQEALEAVGGASYLATVAYTDPKAFCGLVGKMLPLQVGGDPNGVPVAVTVIERTIVRPKKK